MMKNLIAVVLLGILFASCGVRNAQSVAASNYQVSDDNGVKILKGVINRSLIENDTSFKWFKENMRYGQADPVAVEAFKNNKDKFSLIVFGGTWCHDTQNLLPGFYRLIDKSSYPERKITLIGVDRAKTSLDNLHTKYNITRVPTFIVMHDGKEVGRVVEYGKYGTADKELGEIVNNIK
ncbi:MAG: thioredoxin family protein [Chitinophagaceae bacterium]|nr:thioredoxin family protein [Chitinophagaceae bacterium]